jgi:hypothetical protein
VPLIDEHTQGTDRRAATRSPWLLTLLGCAGLWLLGAALLTVLPRQFSSAFGGRAGSAPAPTAAQQYSASVLQNAQQLAMQAEMLNSPTAWQSVTTVLKGLENGGPMSVMDKHTYFKLSAKSLANSGSPLAASRYYERYLRMGLQLRTAGCQECHGGAAAIPPAKLEQLATTQLAVDYVAALRAARQLTPRAASLRKALAAKPKDGAANLLLAVIETAGSQHTKAQQHLKKAIAASPGS